MGEKVRIDRQAVRWLAGSGSKLIVRGMNVFARLLPGPMRCFTNLSELIPFARTQR